MMDHTPITDWYGPFFVVSFNTKIVDFKIA